MALEASKTTATTTTTAIDELECRCRRRTDRRQTPPLVGQSQRYRYSCTKSGNNNNNNKTLQVILGLAIVFIGNICSNGPQMATQMALANPLQQQQQQQQSRNSGQRYLALLNDELRPVVEAFMGAMGGLAVCN